MNSIVQFMLYKVGNPVIENKYKERLRQLKMDHKAIASISFSIRGDSEDCEKTCLEIVELIKKNVEKCELAAEEERKSDKEKEEYEQKRLTCVQCYDIIHENINPKVFNK